VSGLRQPVIFSDDEPITLPEISPRITEADPVDHVDQ
jgi:hypothetical protein